MKLKPLFSGLIVLLLLSSLAIAEQEAERTAKDVLKDLKDRDRGIKILAIAECAQFPDASIGTQLTKMLKEKDFELRMAVIDALKAREDKTDRRRAAQALAARLKPLTGKLQDAEEYEAVIDALGHLAQPCSIKALLDMKTEEDKATAQARLMAVANIPSKDAVEALIQFGSKGRNRGSNNQRVFTAKALQHATGQKFGKDMDKWRAWWRENRDTFDLKMMKAQREAEAAKQAEREARQEEKRRRREEKRRKREEQGGSEGE